MRNMTIIVGLAILIPQTASASWKWVPLEQGLVQADLVVMGKITSVETDDKRMLDIGTITIEKVLKGPADLKSTKLAWRSGVAGPNDVTYKKGQEGVWLMIKDRKYDWHWCSHPVNFQPPSQLEVIKKKLAEIRAWEWGKPVNGLSVHISVLQDKMGYGNPFLAYTKNCSKKTLMITSHPLSRPLSAELIGPDGKPVEVNFYKWIKPGYVNTISKHDFFPIAPGQVKVFRGEHKLPKFTKDGEYCITATLTNREDGKKFNLKDIWTGQAVSNKVSFRISK